MLKYWKFCALLAFCGLLVGIVRADTFHLTDGQTVSGDLVSPNDEGFIVKAGEGSYGERIPWGKLSQDDLKRLQQNPKFSQFVEPFVESGQDEKSKPPEIPNIKPVPRLARPPARPFIAAMATSGIGLFILLLLYAANIYAGYEIAIFRAQPVGMVCGVAAVLPVIGPIIFLSMPTRLRHEAAAVEEAPPDENLETAIAVEETAAAENAAGTGGGQAAAPAVTLPPTKTFARGQYTFNRRFFETQMPGFFAVMRPEADKEMVMTIKSSRGTHTVQRISRISPNELYIQVQKGHASEEVIIPFIEIQEVQLKHKDA